MSLCIKECIREQTQGKKRIVLSERLCLALLCSTEFTRMSTERLCVAKINNLDEKFLRT